MNYVSILRLFFILLFVPYLSTIHTHQDTEKIAYNQPIAKTIPDYFFNPLVYSEQSVTFFLQKIYNDRRYPQFFLATNFMHVIDGINFAPESSQPRLTIEKILTLFHAKLDNIYINPYAFSRFLSSMYPTIARYCNQNQERARTIESIKDCIGSYIIDNYAAFRQDPERVLDEIAQSVYSLAAEPQQAELDIPIRELQHAVFHFLSHGLSQLIWNPADQLETWYNVKLLACQLEKFSEYYIIDSRMLDTLLWKLLNRYGYFISIVAKELNQAFFDTVREDIQSEKAALWLFSEEKEVYITTKLEFLTTTLLEAEITAQVSALATPPASFC